MAQYTEGQHLLGSDGKHYVVRNGVPVSADPVPLVASPKLPGELTGQNLSNQKTAFELQQAHAQASADTRIKNAQAIQEEQKAADAKFAAGDALGDPNLTGPARFSSIPKDKQPMVRLLLDNNLQQLGGFALGKPALQSLISTAKAVDPTFDPSVFGIRYGAMRDFSGGGKNATLVGAAERLALNLQQLKSLSDQMGGPNVGFRPLNSMLASGKESFEPKLSAGYDALLPEIANQFDLFMKTKGTPTVSGTAEVMQGLRRGQSQDERNAAIEQVVKAIRGGLEPIKGQWQSAFGGNSSPPMWISPEAAKFYGQIDPEHTASYNPNDTHGIPGLHGMPGETPPPGAPPGAGYASPPTGPTNGGGMTVTPSTDGFNTTADPQSAAFWTNAVHLGTPYRDALNQWQADVKTRGLVGMTPPPGDKYKLAVDYAAKYPNAPYQPFSSVTHTPVDPLHRAATDAAFSGPGVAVGHAANALGANLPTLLAGDQGARYNAVSNATHPNWALGGDVAGTVGGALGAQKLLEGAAPYLGAYGKVIAPNAARAALSGDTAFFGASGAAANPDHPVLGAAEGMASGMAGNAAGRYLVGPAFRAALDASPVQSLINGVGKARGMFGGTPLPEFNPPAALDAGQNMIFKRANPAIDAITAKLQSAKGLGLPYALADADPRLQALAGSAARKSPDALALANQVLVPRQAGQAERAIGQINNLAPVGDVPTMQANLLKQAQKQSGPLYDAAKAQSAPELTANPALKEVLDRPAAQAAIRKGYETALNNGEDVGTLTYATDPQGNPVQYGNPSWNVIHHARRALDANGDTAVRHALDKQIAGINPGFKAADAAYSTVLKGSDALQAGADATKIGVTPEQAQAALNSSAKNTPQFQQGYASNMADQIERGRLSGGNPYNLVHGSLGQQAKMNMIFPQGASNFATAHALENDMSGTYREALGGSQTAARTEADKAFDHAGGIATDLAMAPVTHGASLTGLGMTGVRKALGYLSDRTQLGMSAAKANSLAPYLLNTDPHANLILLHDIAAQQAARQAYLQNFGAVTGNVGSGMFAAPFIYGANGQ